MDTQTHTALENNLNLENLITPPLPEPKKKIKPKLNSEVETQDQLDLLLKTVKAVRSGDFSVRVPLLDGGIISEVSEVINDIIQLNESLANEFIRVQKNVGQAGKMTERVSMVSNNGAWATSIDSINSLITDLVQPTREAARVITAVAQGDLSKKMSMDIEGRSLKGEFARIGNTVNSMVDQLSSFASEVTRVAKEVGTEGKLGGQANVKGVSGIWKDLTDNVNQLAGNLTSQVRNIAKVTTAVAKGDLSQKITVDVRGEILELKDTINTMVDQLNSFGAEVTRVAKEVGTEGKLGGQANVKGVSGIWKDLTDNVNQLAGNLTSQVRNIAKVTTAVAKGDLSQKITVDVRGEILELKDTINTMVDQLNSFAVEVTRVAKEVGIEGKLGGQARVPGAMGTWKDLTDNVNQLAGNLTTQVRAIAEVSTAVTKGDLTRLIMVKAQGEVAALKNNINQMIENLQATTQKNTEQDWLKSNLAKFSGMMQGQRSISAIAQLIMSELTPLVGGQYGAFFMNEGEGEEASFNLIAGYAFTKSKTVPTKYKLREGLIGQCAFEKKRILLTTIPENYIYVASSLGKAKPLNVIILPVLFEGETKAVIELASLKPFLNNHLYFLDQLMERIGVVLNMITSMTRTEELLQEIKRSNVELEAQAKELEEKAGQLSLISKYKTDFLANMSHELRTPLNSLLILSKTLAKNKDQNLTSEQVKYASTVYSAGADLLALINEILDLSKIEAGKMPIYPREIAITELQDRLEQTFYPIAEHKGLHFEIEISPQLPPKMFTDLNRLHQILRNLLSNAFKFTEKGNVILRIGMADKGLISSSTESLKRARKVIYFSVSDTGIGISKEKQKLIFEAFQQGDGTTSRKYGGTGLGLTISRELARLLGGTIEVKSKLGKESNFTLYLPENCALLSAGDSYSKEDQAHLIPPLPEGVDFTGKWVLVVDDDTRNAYAISTVLEARGMSVVSAENGKVGIKILEENPNIDLILMDLMMPEMDGIEATQQIRKLPKFTSLPIISVTAKAMKGDREKAMAAGATDYITKPVDPDQLLSLIYLCLKKSPRDPQNANQT